MYDVSWRPGRMMLYSFLAGGPIESAIQIALGRTMLGELCRLALRHLHPTEAFPVWVGPAPEFLR